MTKFSFCIFVASLVALAQASNVAELNSDNFDSTLAGKPALVEFFAPWCGHCKNLAPTYEQLADAFAHAKDKVIIAKVDADGAGKSLGTKYGVSGFPTIKWFDSKGVDTPYEGGRELEDLASFVTQKSGVKSNFKPPPPSAMKILDILTFDDVALNGSSDVLVAFTAPWCGHCKSLKPIYEEVAKDFAAEKNCIIANVDADAVQNKPLGSKYGVASYPTIKFFPKHSKDEPEPYEGPRTREGFIEFLNDRCGTYRSIGGGLNQWAGRVENMDALAAEFIAATVEGRNTLLNKALAAGADAKHYARVMQKVIGGSHEYIEKEVRRLRSIIEKRALLAGKLDEIQMKLNVLSAFQEQDKNAKIERSTAEL